MENCYFMIILNLNIQAYSTLLLHVLRTIKMKEYRKWTHQCMQRRQFFERSLESLSVAAETGFDSFQESACLIKSKLSAIPMENSDNTVELKSDKELYSIFPTNEFPDLVPVAVADDGNSLPRSASMLVFGDQMHHIEMRVRLACELALNKDYYLNDDNHKMYQFDSTAYCQIISSYSYNFKSDIELSKENIHLVFERDAMDTCSMDKACGIWHLYALSSIVGCKLYSIYPKVIGEEATRKHLNRIIFPKKQISKKTLAIFWTDRKQENRSDSNNNDNCYAHYFVPCFPNHFVFKQSMQIQPSTKYISKCEKTPNTKSMSTKPELFNKEVKSKDTTRIDKQVTTEVKSQTPSKKSVRFTVDSKCDLAFYSVTKYANKIQIKSTKKRRNPLKSLLKFLVGHQLNDSRGPDVSFFELE